MTVAMTAFHKTAPIPLPATLPMALMLIATLGGCAGSGTFPSLARRPQEVVAGRITGTLAPAPATVAAAPLPGPAPQADAAATLIALQESASIAHDRFTALLQRDARAISAGRGAAAGSDSWAQAQAAIADLTGEHDVAVATLAEIDRLYVQDRVDGGDGGAITAVRDQVTAWVAEQNAVLAELGGGPRG